MNTQDESRRFNVLMEKLLSKFRTFGEAQSLMREDVNSLKPRFDKLEEKADLLESAVRTNSRETSSLKEAVQRNTEAIHAIHIDFKNINHRVNVVESKLAS